MHLANGWCESSSKLANAFISAMQPTEFFVTLELFSLCLLEKQAHCPRVCTAHQNQRKLNIFWPTFPVPHGVERTFQGAKERKSTAEIFSAKLPAMAASYGRLHCFKAKAIRTDLLRNFGRSNKVQYTALGAAHPMCSFSRPEVPNSLFKKNRATSEKNNFLLLNIFEPLPFSSRQQVHSFLDHLFGAAMCGAVFIAYCPFGNPTRGSPWERPCCFLTQHFL
jgi:hypothetical protein